MAKKHKKIDRHVHIWEIPKRYFPRNTKAKEYQENLVRITGMLQYTNQRVQYGAQICAFNIKSINQKTGFTPSLPEAFRAVEEFVYHYENYCHRLFAYRENLLQFINSILPVGYTEKQVRIEHILINPIVRRAKLMGLLEKFSKNTVLSKMIKDRHSLTHRLYYGTEFDHFFRPKVEKEIKKPEQFKKWCYDWKKQITERAKQANDSTRATSNINNTIAKRVIDYKEELRK
ncbi:MAG: Cthe_2314 family HEPN domain-containing protein [Candidatus Sungiibacteriota bacterium]